MAQNRNRRAGAVRPTRRASGAVAAAPGGGRSPWLLGLLALLGLVAAVALISFLTHRAGDTTAAAPTTSPVSTATAVSSPAVSTAVATATPAPSGATGQLTSNGQALYPATGTVSPQAGQPATGSSVGVVELAGAPAAAGSAALDDERFFVGDAAHETLVFLHINAEPPFEITPGQHYTFNGTVRPYTPGAVSGLTDAAKATVEKAGHYIEVTDLSQFHAG